MKFYKFRQNNSGGVFYLPAIIVYVEAENSDEANLIAQANGIYFDDEYEIDCECCGSRWNSVSEFDATEEIEEEDSELIKMFSKSDNVPTVAVIAYDFLKA